jgi:hypothetical protein
MDLYSANAANTLHAQAARRAEQEREYRRVAAERTAALGGAEVEAPTPARRRHGFAFTAMLRTRTRSAQ